VDNNLGTRWSASGNGQWLQLNLGSVKPVGYVKVGFYKGNERTSSFDIMVSTNGSVWTNVRTTGSFTSSGSTTAEQTFDFTDVNAQYVRYVGKGNSVNDWNSVGEISVFQGTVGVPGTPTATPTATPRPTGPTPTPRPTATPTPGGTWKRANLTNFESYPAPDSGMP